MELSSILLILLILVIVAAVVYLFYKWNRQEEYPTDNIKVECHMLQFSNGSKEGWFVKRIWGKKRSIIIFQPSDINFNKPQLVKNQRVVVKNSILDKYSTPKGIESNEIGYMYLFPHRADLFSKTDQKRYSKEFLEEVETIGEIDDIIEIKNNKEKIQKKLLMKTEGWDMFDDYVKKKKLLDKDIIQDIKSLRDDKKTFTPTSGSSGGF